MNAHVRGVAAIILAAGASTRLGRPKQLVRWGDQTLLEHAVAAAVEAGCVPFVVLGCYAEQIISACDLSVCNIVINPAWRQGMGGSIRVGIEAASALRVDEVIVMACDQPAVNAEYLRLLMAAGNEERVVASAYTHRKGVPAYFPAAFFAALQALDGDSGARNLLQEALSIELPHGELDVDTEETLELAQSLLLRAQD